jgi:hypothetical protein
MCSEVAAGDGEEEDEIGAADFDESSGEEEDEDEDGSGGSVDSAPAGRSASFSICGDDPRALASRRQPGTE